MMDARKTERYTTEENAGREAAMEGLRDEIVKMSVKEIEHILSLIKTMLADNSFDYTDYKNTTPNSVKSDE